MTRYAFTVAEHAFVLPYLAEMVWYGLAAIGMEVIYTSVDFDDHLIPRFKSRDGNLLMGYSSAWYFIPYGFLMPFIQLNYEHFYFSLPWYTRVLAYGLSFMVCEYLSMLALRLLLGKSPSEDSYYSKRFHLHGLTRLDMLVPYGFAGLFFEWLYLEMHRIY